MKVIINVCYGGFGLSSEAVKRAAQEGAKCVSAIPVDQWFGDEWPDKIDEFTKDLGDGYSCRDTSWGEDILYRKGMIYTIKDTFDNKNEIRSDPVLVRIVEEMGEAASGYLGELKVVEIPDGTDFVISEYDGWEHIAESHLTWG